MRLLTANVFNDRAAPTSVAAALDRYQPDVVALQELGPAVARVVAQRYSHGCLDPATDHSGIGLVARMPISVDRHPLVHRDALRGKVGELTIWTVHLANPVAFPPPWRARRAQLRGLATALSNAERTVLVGDLNATPAWPAYRKLIATGLRDGVADWARGEARRPRSTWGYRPFLPAMLRIDHVLVADVSVTRCEVVRVAGADHRAVVVDLEEDLTTRTSP